MIYASNRVGYTRPRTKEGRIYTSSRPTSISGSSNTTSGRAFQTRPSSRIQIFPPFAIKVIQRFSSLRLSSTKAIIGASDAQRPAEARFQDEFYRCCHSYSGGSLVSFPEFGNGSEKSALYLPLKQWGVELLRDGDGLENYSSRFTGPDAYVNMEFKDHIILDFRTTQPQNGDSG